MSKLLSAHFSRLKRNTFFWLCNIAMIIFSIVLTSIIKNYNMSFDIIAFAPYLTVGILLSVFCSMFIGTEYSDGTIRNKLIVGQSRKSIYLSNFIISSVAGICMVTVYLSISCFVGIPLLGWITITPLKALFMTICGMLITITFSAIYTLISMLIQNKALIVIVCILCFIFTYLFSILIYNRLEEPEMIQSYQTITTQSGKKIIVGTRSGDEIELVSNPRYISGKKRKVYQFIADFLPTSQSVQLIIDKTLNLWWMMLYSIILILVINSIGIFVFKRKDIK